MKLILLTSILFAALSFNMSIAQQQQGDAPDRVEGYDKKQKLEKRHHHRRAHHRQKIHKMMMSKADTNGDGKVDLNEYLQNAEQRFTTMDADSDGFVTGEEMRSAGKTMRKKHKEAMKEARKSYKESLQDSE